MKFNNIKDIKSIRLFLLISLSSIKLFSVSSLLILFYETRLETYTLDWLQIFARPTIFSQEFQVYIWTRKGELSRAPNLKKESKLMKIRL